MHVELVIKLKLQTEAFDLCGDAPKNGSVRVISHRTAQSMSHYSFIIDH